MYVLDFKGDIRASAVASLREEVTAVLAFARPEDEVLVRLENAGGLVHEHGLAASQLMRVRARGIPLTVSVDKIAASGGYMMACVADRILAAPFAVLGSIGVLAQIPNFHRLLDSHGIDFEQSRRGIQTHRHHVRREFRRRPGEVEAGHRGHPRYLQELRHRAASGARHREGRDREHWLARRAKDLGLCDTLITSDDYLLEANGRAELVGVRFVAPKRLSARLAESLAVFAGGAEAALWASARDRRLSL